MDDSDAVLVQIGRSMLDSGDWVTAHQDGIPYLEKSPLGVWMIAVCFMIFGMHDWAGRLPVALSAVALCWLAFRMGAWAFSRRAGMYAGMAVATCLGLFLFTRIQIPDVTVTAAIALTMWAFLRALDPAEQRPAMWSAIGAASIGIGLMLKGLIAAVFPVAGVVLFLACTGEWRERSTWRRLHPFWGLLIVLAVAAPWHVLATLRELAVLRFRLAQRAGPVSGVFLVLLL